MKSEKKVIKNRAKMQFLESAYNEIISTIGSRPAESGGLLFGKEDDFVIRKFVFDKNAHTTRSSYTFNTDFLNPEIKRIWTDEGLSCIGFIHSHPYGYDRLSPPDLAYFTSMFEFMPRKQYLTPIVFTAPDGGFKLHAHILPSDSKETISAEVYVLPDDFSEEKIESSGMTASVSKPTASVATKIKTIEGMVWVIWRLITVFGLSWFVLKALYLVTNHLNKIFNI